MSNIANLVVAKAIRDRKIVVKDFALAKQVKGYTEFYEKFGNTKSVQYTEMDLTGFSDEIASKLVNFMWYCIDETVRGAAVFHSGIFVSGCHLVSFLSDNGKSDYDSFLEELECFRKGKPVFRSFVNLFHKYLDVVKYKDDIYASDIWDINKINLAPERKCAVIHRNLLFFGKVKNVRNKELLKMYFKYILMHTNQSINSISNQLSSLANVLNLMDKPYDKWNKDNVGAFVSKMHDKYTNKKTLATRLLDLERFAEYLVEHNIIKDSPTKHLHDLRQYSYTFKERACSDNVVKQIMYALGSFKDISLVICFLLIKTTGMRVTEACSIEKNCLEKTDKGYFVRFYSTKMRKDVTNEIPAALYNMIAEYRETVDKNCKFLFPGKKPSYPRQRNTFTDKFKEELSCHNIRNDDGSAYAFRAHDFRHLMAVRMRDKDIPFQYIQEQLHHLSPEMTLAYTEFLDKQKLLKMKKFVSANADIAPIPDNAIDVVADDYAECMRKFLVVRATEYGTCARPIKMAKCPHCGACYECDSFRTTVDDLPIHMAQLERSKRLAEVYEKQGWIIQAKQNQEMIVKLEKLISKLQSIGDTDE